MFDVRKNLVVGLLFILAFALITAFWQQIETILNVWEGALIYLPIVSWIIKRPDPVGKVSILIFGTICWILLGYFVGLSFRSLGLYVAADIKRARRITRIAIFLKLGFLWRVTIGVAILGDALTGLPRVRMEEYKGKRGFGFVTKVQRFHQKGKRSWWEFIVYSGDFPAYFLGRWSWYLVESCQKVLNPLGQMIATFATVGLGAPDDMYVDNFTVEDLREMARKIKEKEAILIAAGLADPNKPIIEEIETERENTAV